MKKCYLVITVLIMSLLVISCGQSQVKIPPAAISEIYALSGTEAVGKYIEIKDVQDRKDVFYIMLYIKALPGEFRTLEEALPQAKAVTRTVIESTVGILKKYNINQKVSVWAQLPLKEGGVTVLGHAEYDGKSYRDFEPYKP